MTRRALSTTFTPDHHARLLRFGASASLAAAVAGAALAQGAPEILPLFEPFERSFDQGIFLAGGEALAVDLEAIKAMPADRASVIAGFPIGRTGSLDLVVERIAPLASDARLEIVTPAKRKGAPALVEAMEWPEAHLFGGTVVGEASSRVFLSVTEAGVFGFVESEAGRFILSSGPYGSGQAPAVFSMDGDAFAAVDWLDFGCSALPRPDAGERGEGASEGGAAEMMMPSCRSIEMALETDQEYLTKFSGNVAAAVGYAQTLVAAADEIYRRDAGVQIRLTYTRIWTTQDPWNTSSSSAALPEFRDYWNSYQGSVGRDVAHMLSGRALGGGIAWLDAVCSDYAFGVNGNLSGFFPTPMVMNSPQNWDVMVFNHELGHNAGSIHTHDRSPPVDNCGNGNCSGAANGTIMSYCHQCSGGMNNIALQFHPLSAGEIVEYVSGASCATVVECSSNPACVLSISASSGSFGLVGGTASISVTTIGPLCDWTPVSAPSWITVTNPGPASGPGTFAFTVQANAGASRSALLAFGDLTYTVTQSGFTDCDANGVNDETQIAANPSLDCDSDGVLNACEIAAGASDCDANGVPDGCQDFTAVLGWGAGEPGETGGNNNGQSTTPSLVTGPVQIAAGYGHSLARRLDGAVVAWGRNFEGQTAIPAGLGPCLKVAAGAFHSLAIRQIGTVAAWGRNFDGQCDVPPMLGAVVDIAGGNAHSAALKPDGTVVCWGQNNLGQSSVPAALAGVTDIEAGYLHTLALRSNGTVTAWGDAAFGQTGVPAGLANVTAISSAGYHSLALRADGTVVAWGMNIEGQCDVPADLGAVRAIGTGMLHSIAIRTDGTVRAWGRNSDGQCDVPAAASNAQQVAGGAHHTLVFASAPGLADCDGDGTADACEIASGAPDTNANGIPDGCEGVIGDLNGDGVVNAEDLARLLASWGGSGAANGDIDGNGTIGGADLAAMLANWTNG